MPSRRRLPSIEARTCSGRPSRPAPGGLPRFQQDALRDNLAIVERVREVARRAGATPAQVALAWVLAQGRHVVPIPGTKTPRYLADNAGAADIALNAAELAEVDALPPPQGAGTDQPQIGATQPRPVTVRCARSPPRRRSQWRA